MLDRMREVSWSLKELIFLVTSLDTGYSADLAVSVMGLRKESRKLCLEPNNN